MELKVIFSRPYNEVKIECMKMKQGDVSVIDEHINAINDSLPAKCVLIPMPQSSGRAEYTLSLATTIAQQVNELYNGKTVVVLDCLYGKVRDSVCGRKQKGEPFDDIDFGFGFKDRQEERLSSFFEDGWSLILVDNVVDTGTTAIHAIHAMNRLIEEVSVLALGDTEAWKNF